MESVSFTPPTPGGSARIKSRRCHPPNFATWIASVGISSPPSTGRRRYGVGLCYRWHLRVPALGLGRGHVDVDGVNVLDDHLSCYELLGERAGHMLRPVGSVEGPVYGNPD